MSASSSRGSTQGNNGQPTDLRSKVVEILASTANGCLTELGYYPGMSQKVQELEQLNAKWKQENMKLFQDNQSLTRALIEHAESNLAKTIRDLQRQNEALQRDNASLVEQNQNLLAGHPATYHQLLNEHKWFKEQAMTEISILRHSNAILSGRTPVHSPSTPASVLMTPSIPTAGVQFAYPSPPVRHVIPGAVANLPSQLPSYPSPPHRRVAAPPTVPASLTSYLPQSLVPIAPSQGRQIVGVQKQPQQLKEANIPTSISREIRRPHSVGQSVLIMDSSRPAPLRLSLGSNSGEITRCEKNNHDPACSSTPQSAPPVPQHGSYVPVLLPQIPAVPHGAPRSAQPTHPPPVNAMPMSQARSLPSSPLPLTPTFIPISSLSQPNDSAIAEKDASSEAVKLSPLVHNAPVNVNHASPSETTPPKAVTPMVISTEAPSTVPIVSSPPMEYLKRPSLTINLEELPVHKKLRLDEVQDVIEIPSEREAVEQKVDEAGSSTPVNVEMDVKEEVEGNGVVEDDEDEESEEEIRVGADGLRLVEDCVKELVEDDENNDSKTCKLCIARFRLGYTKDKPKPFVNASTEQLVQHCSSEHQTAWDKIRRVV